MAIVPTPTIPAQFAGEVAASADMNAFAGAAQFLLNKPITMIGASGTWSTATNTGFMLPSTASLIVDTDGMWPTAGHPAYLSIQRYGLYWMEVNAKITSTANVIALLQLGVWGGSNNPFVAFNTGLFIAGPYIIVPGTGIAYVKFGTVLAAPCFPGDFCGSYIQQTAGTATSGTFSGTITVRWVGLP